MPWTLTLSYDGGGSLVFAVTDSDKAMPIVEPTFEYEHASGAAPQVVAVEEVWQIRNAYYRVTSDTETMVDAWATLKTNLETPASTPVGVSLALDGTPKLAMSTSTHDRLRCTRMRLHGMTRGGGASFMRFDLEVRGRKVVQASAVELQYSYSYERGLEVRTLRSKVRTKSGTSAKSTCESVGLLSLPSAYWRRDQAKDPYVDVTYSEGDTVAEGTCTIRETGLAAPSGANEWTKRVETYERGDESRTVYRFAAQGASALTLVLNQKPVGTLETRTSQDVGAQTAEAFFVVEEVPDTSPDGKTVRRSRSFELQESGHPPITITRTSEGPWRTVGARGAWTVVERYQLEARGVTSVDQLQIDAPLWPDAYDPHRSDPGQPRVLEDATDDAARLWGLTAIRTYHLDEPPERAKIFEAVLLAARLRTLEIEESDDA